ncbi:MAG TPA: SDR family NAD(P)-dependent oxidoreductase [Tepidisphaeraceae bacterium]|jgi:NAD(P)-dependent dehydrogenase (short-subunit alcohol dehydrogenase family)|nr:SDR family NAD(P)-dependent oxidoreductase [Tepidisphaeraceae bacterium]
MQFTNQTILIAGGTGGLGRAVSLAFLEEGAKVAVTYRKAEEFASLQASAGPNASRLDGYVTDVTDESAVAQLIEKNLSKHGRLDALVNTVGGFTGGQKFWEADSKSLDQMLNLNLRSGWILARAAARPMLKSGRGSIVNIASRAAVDHSPALAAYSASKAAAVAMIDSLAADLKGTGVRANSVLPSIIDTEINRKMMPKADFSKWPKPEEISKVVLFLCSEDAKLINGAAVTVYGES